MSDMQQSCSDYNIIYYYKLKSKSKYDRTLSTIVIVEVYVTVLCFNSYMIYNITVHNLHIKTSLLEVYYFGIETIVL